MTAYAEDEAMSDTSVRHKARRGKDSGQRRLRQRAINLMASETIADAQTTRIDFDAA